MALEAEEMAAEARRLYGRSYQGILSTISVELGGSPFGSVVTFARDRAGRPLFLISRIAEHTRNVQADSRVSLTMTEDSDDAQAAGRLTVVGRAIPVPEVDQQDSAQRYYRRVPHAEAYHRAHHFELYRLEPGRIRYIAGFGEICWLEPHGLCLANPFTPSVENGMLAHMNRDHVAAMRDYCRMFAVEPGTQDPRLAAIDREGFDLMIGKHLLRIDFEAPVSSPDEVRRAMVALAMNARESGLQPA